MAHKNSQCVSSTAGMSGWGKGCPNLSNESGGWFGHLPGAAGGISWAGRVVYAWQRMQNGMGETWCSSTSQPSFHGKT